ncbi:MAG: hypothetical protein OXC13_12670, partial [Caldilineaceae bacterium]|nr:hypothetical protein [Caldilineaceae bacterium]
GHEHPWVLLTDTPPQHTEATLYACRDGIEQGFRGPGAPAGSGSARVAPTRCARDGTGWCWPWPACWRSPTARAGRKPPPWAGPPHGCAPLPTVPAATAPRRLSLLRQGMACLGALLAQGRWWTRLWLRPRPGPYGPPAMRALAQGP